MEYEQHIAAVEQEAERLAAALGAGPLDAPVPTCPGWDVRALAGHVGDFTGFWTHVLCEGTGRPKPEVPALAAADGSEQATAWYRGLAATLVEELRATPATTEVWTWVPDDHTARFTARRCAHELAVHRVDAQMAREGAEPIDADLASDGIEEIFVMVAARGLPTGRGSGETIHLHGTDREDEWLLTTAEDGLHVERRHAKGDLALRGAVSDLELVLYNRPPLGPVERFGDEAALDAWYGAFTF